MPALLSLAKLRRGFMVGTNLAGAWRMGHRGRVSVLSPEFSVRSSQFAMLILVDRVAENREEEFGLREGVLQPYYFDKRSWAAPRILPAPGSCTSAIARRSVALAGFSSFRATS